MSDDSASVWLVKIPGYLHQYLSKKMVDGDAKQKIGTLVVDEGDMMGFKLELPDTELKGKPSTFSIKKRPFEQQLKTFREDSQGDVTMMGTVSLQGNMLPEMGKEYAKMMEKKFTKSEVKRGFFVFLLFFFFEKAVFF
jgi:hypothetical protein